MSSTGRNNEGRERLDRDRYATPPAAIEALIPLIEWQNIDSFLEPCVGTGVIRDAVPLKAKRKKWAEIEKGRDYLTTRFVGTDLIITNPPYSLAEEFLVKAIREAPTVIFLLPLNFFGSELRLPFWCNMPAQRCNAINTRRLRMGKITLPYIGPPNYLFPMAPRLSFVHGGNDSNEYAWFAWCRAYGHRVINSRAGAPIQVLDLKQTGAAYRNPRIAA